MFLEWNEEKHSLGIPVIDNQHKELFLITNHLHDVINLKEHKNKAIKVIERLYAYTNYHFACEEEILDKYLYPEKVQHKKIHNAFKNKIKETLAELKRNNYLSLVPLQDYLIEWILKHIQGEDVKYKAFFNKYSLIPEIETPVKDENINDRLSQWKIKKLNLEIKDIDNQHKELIEILRQTNDLLRTSESRKKIYLQSIFQKLLYYSQYHFSYEEEHMSKNNYKFINEHKKLHKIYIDEIIHLSLEYKKGTSLISENIISFLKNWIINHILKEDKKYKNYLEEILKLDKKN